PYTTLFRNYGVSRHFPCFLGSSCETRTLQSGKIKEGQCPYSARVLPEKLGVGAKTHSGIWDIDPRENAHAVEQLAPCANGGAFANHTIFDVRISANASAGGNDGIGNSSARFNGHAIKDHGPVKAAARANLPPAPYGGTREQQHSCCHARGGINQGLASLAFHQRGMRNAADEIGRAADEVIGTAHVAPVGVVHVSKNVIASFQHTRESFALYGDHAVFRNGSNEIFFKDIAAGINLIGWRIFGLFQKLQHAAIFISGHATESPWIAHVEQMHGQVRIFAVMRIEDFT